MAMPSTLKKTEVVAFQHVMEEGEKPLAPTAWKFDMLAKNCHTAKALLQINYVLNSVVLWLDKDGTFLVT